jgi:putative SOS response-associated peptidase YedK
MPVILTTPNEFDRWLEADAIDALTLQRPLPDDALQVCRARREGRQPNGEKLARIMHGRLANVA